MVKKIICLIAVVVFCFSFSVLAEDDFLVYGKDDLTATLNMSESEIDAYCKGNDITYFAINSDNTKQIKRTETKDAFAAEIIDFVVLDDSEILELSPQLSTFPDAKGEIVNLNGYKLLKSELKTTDSGGEYVLTQFVTVKNAKKITLSFYTAGDTDRGYIEGILEEQFPKEKNYKTYIIVGVVVFSLLAAAAAILIVKDLKEKEN